MLRAIFLLVLAGVVGLLVWVGLQSPSYRVERSAVINAAPGAVYAQVYDFKNWQAWSPWAKLDPEAKITYEGPTSGPGAIMRWAGNNKVGRGALAITEAVPESALKMRLDFAEPMQGTSDVGFTFQPDGQGTRVTWTIAGQQSFVERLMCTLLRVDLEREIGAEYERGLANLKTVAESAPPAAAPTASEPAPTPPG